MRSVTTVKLTGSIAGLAALLATSAAIGHNAPNGPVQSPANNDLVGDFYGVRSVNLSNGSGSGSMSVTVNGRSISVPERGSVTDTVPDPGHPGSDTTVHISVHNDVTPDDDGAKNTDSDVHISANSSNSATVNVNSHSNSVNNHQNSGFSSNSITRNGKVITNTQHSY